MKRFFVVVPCYDVSNDPDHTDYVECDPEEAEIWSIMESDTAVPGTWELIDDCDHPTREVAYAAAMALGYKPEQEEL